MRKMQVMRSEEIYIGVLGLFLLLYGCSASPSVEEEEYIASVLWLTVLKISVISNQKVMSSTS